jgi:tetratricopeptide (TPR) repeat protein
MKLAPILTAGLALFMAACGSDVGGAGKGDDYTSSVKQADEARKSGDFDSAVALYGRALQAKPDGIEAKLGLGQAYLTLGLPDEAAALFRDVLQRREGDQAARRGLACVDAPVDARGFLTAPAMIGCGHVSGLEARPCRCRGPVWRYADQVQIKKASAELVDRTCFSWPRPVRSFCPYRSSTSVIADVPA